MSWSFLPSGSTFLIVESSFRSLVWKSSSHLWTQRRSVENIFDWAIRADWVRCCFSCRSRLSSCSFFSSTIMHSCGFRQYQVMSSPTKYSICDSRLRVFVNLVIMISYLYMFDLFNNINGIYKFLPVWISQLSTTDTLGPKLEQHSVLGLEPNLRYKLRCTRPPQSQSGAIFCHLNHHCVVFKSAR